MKILIYGLGKEALLAKKALRKEHIFIGFTDSFSNIESYAGFKFYERRSVNKIDFEYIVLALSSRRISESVKADLVSEGIEADKIIDFMQLYVRQKVDKVMYGCKGIKIDGIILGLSHALAGINPTYLNGDWKNLATPGEDLYCHYKVLKKAAKCYSDIIKNLKYAIVEMYDYTVFNYDVSLSRNILNYLSWGGYAEDFHHFNENRNYVGTIEEEMRRVGYYIPIVDKKDFQLADRLFDTDVVAQEMEYLYMSEAQGQDGFRDYPLQIKMDRIISEEPMLPYNLFYMGGERYPETIEENKIILKETVKLLKQINPQIRIFFILLPRFGNMEKYHRCLLEREKAEFENIMKEYLEEKNCFYFDFKQYKKISNNRYFFWDVAHLNYMGAIAFTGLLNNCLFNEI